MTALIIVVSVIVILALLRLGAAAEFGSGGLSVTARAGFVSVRILPARPRREKPKKARPVKEKPVKAKQKKEKEKEPGRLSDYMTLVQPALKSLGRFRRRLLIKRLVIHYIAAGDDAYKTAMSFGAVNAAGAVAAPLLENCFRVKRREFKFSADFEADEPYIYVSAAISLAVWELVYIVICLIPPLLKRPVKKTDRKENESNGKTSDRRADGNYYAEDSRNGGRKHDNRRAD